MLTSKKDYLNYLDSLEKVELAKEYENIYCFYEHLKYHYDLLDKFVDYWERRRNETEK